MDYYDVILGLIPVVLAGVAGGLLAIGFDLTVATPLAALGAITLIGHAMFVNGPTDDPSQDTPAITATTDTPAVNSAD
jgi:hypothetical protein